MSRRTVVREDGIVVAELPGHLTQVVVGQDFYHDQTRRVVLAVGTMQDGSTVVDVRTPPAVEDA